ncbi:MAG: Wzz/FepE/Etk N-terminal domain-containing protein [Candidatus Latescibacterota bacterium]
MQRDHYLLDYAYVLVKWRRFIGLSVVAVTLAAAAVSLVLPKRWTATTVLLPPEEGADSFSLQALLQTNIPPNLQRLAGPAPGGGRLLTILGSRRGLGVVVDSLGLVQVLGAPSRNHAIGLLDENLERRTEREGALIISATASTPELAADIANAVAREVDAVNRQSKSQPARELRQFLEERMRVAASELDSAGRDVQRFQDTYGLVDLEAQTTAAVEVVQAVQQQLMQLGVQLGMSRQILEPDQEERARLELEVDQMRRQLRLLVGGARAADAGDESADLRSLGPSLQDIPGLAQTYGRLFLDLGVKQATLSFLSTRLEEAKYREALDTPTLLVLDPAEPPQIRSAPRRTLIVVVAFCTSVMLCAALALVLESWSEPSPQSRGRLRQIRELLGRPE